MLFLGVSVVQLQPVDGPVAQSPEESIPTISPLSQTQNPLLGLAAVVASSLCSGFAGKLVKNVFFIGSIAIINRHSSQVIQKN